MPPPVITSVVITTAHPTLAAVGAHVNLGARVENSNNEVVSDAHVEWTSSSANVATAFDGVLTAMGNGTTVITASYGGQTDTTTATVFTVRSLAISPARPTLHSIGDTATLSVAAIDGQGAAVHDVAETWESSTPAVATVENGVVVAHANGITIVTAHLDSLVDSTTVTVLQQPAQIAFLTQPGQQLQGRVIGPVIQVAATDARGVRVTAPTAPVAVTISVGGLIGTTTRGTTAGVASFDDLVATYPARPVQLVARLGELSASSSDFGVWIAFTSISAGFEHTCGLTATGRAYCWGDMGLIGDGFTITRRTPRRVSGGDVYGALYAGFNVTWALTRSGALVTWGSVPAAFVSPQVFTSLSVNQLACGITANQFAYCWGGFGQSFGSDLPDGTWATQPTLAMGGRKVLALVSGAMFTCAIAAADSTAWCAGLNEYGQLGDGTTVGSDLPVPVAGGLKFRALRAGTDFICGIVTTGDTYCWGMNDAGQLGDPTEMETRSSRPRLVGGGYRFRTISAGGYSTCGLTDDGTAYCWGSNPDGLITGNGPDAISTPTLVGGSEAIKFNLITVGGLHVCGIATTGISYCWGDSNNGATGNGIAYPYVGPVPIGAPDP